MNVNIYCSAVISKKLSKICQDNLLFVFIQPAENGKKIARLKLTCPDDVKIDDIKKIEDVSIMLGIEDVSEDIKDLGEEKPIASLYASAEKIDNSKLAITDPDTEIKKYKNTDKVEKQKEIVVLQSKNIQKSLISFISDYRELIKITSAIKDIDKEIPKVQSDKKLSRGEAIELEKNMKSVPRLPFGVFISNETKGRLCIDDLNLILNVNEIIDLSSVPAQKIKNSRELRIACEKGFVKFRSPGEYNEWCKRQFNSNDGVDRDVGLAIFDNHEEAAMATDNIMESSTNVVTDKQNASKASTFIDKVNIVKKSNNNIMPANLRNSETIDVTGDEETEEEKEIKALIKDLPKDRDEPENDSVVENSASAPLLSDMVEEQEKNKIKRI